MAHGNGNRQGSGDGTGDRREPPRRREAATTKAVYALTERDDRTYWTRIGIGFVNADQSITVKLDALPVSGTLQIRDDDRGEREGR